MALPRGQWPAAQRRWPSHGGAAWEQRLRWPFEALRPPISASWTCASPRPQQYHRGGLARRRLQLLAAAGATAVDGVFKTCTGEKVTRVLRSWELQERQRHGESDISARV